MDASLQGKACEESGCIIAGKGLERPVKKLDASLQGKACEESGCIIAGKGLRRKWMHHCRERPVKK
eukprot:1141038-Pelagomonas_calceolata.AAC.1